MTPRTLTADAINAMTDQEYKVLENRLRRSADRQGLRLEKSRSRDPRATDYGTYHLVDASTSGLVAYGLQSGYGLGLDEIARELRMGSERDDVIAEAMRRRYQVARHIASHSDIYEKLTRRVQVTYDSSFRDVQAVAVEGSSQSYPPTLDGALEALAGPANA
ncbi:MAG: hypothetical protein K2X52_10135 [Mycobacteriaceae bacterium]|nr:hypothetical protein [Mycobacteriaceae bacterium]